MKAKIQKLSILLAVLFIAGFTSCQKDGIEPIQTNAAIALDTPSNPVSGEGITPFISSEANNGGNVDCEDVLEGEFLTTGRINVDDFDSVEEFEAAFAEFGIYVTVTDETYVSFTTAPGVAVYAAIVKGGNDANVYIYENGTTDDSGLASPVNPNGDPAGLSNLTFCYLVEESCEWEGETAWGNGTRFVPRGNWAMYTPYQSEETVDLIAGQHHVAGTIEFSEVVDGEVTITIILNDGFRLKEVEGAVVGEAVKIQGYENTPASRNPAPGQFKTYKGIELEITVPAYAFYGIHLDVEREVCE